MRILLRLAGVAVALPGLACAVLAAGLAGAPAVSASPAALADVPAPLAALYQQQASRCPGLHWPLLAAVGKVATDHGRAEPSAGGGTVGLLRFPPVAWARYGSDGGGDGRVDPQDPADALATGTDLLCRLGAATDPAAALAAYRCALTGPPCPPAPGYVATVLAVAARYTQPAAGDPGPVASRAVAVALAQVGTPYLWGGQQPGGFDCSGLVRYAYAAAGVALPRVAADQYRAGPPLPPGAPAIAGDLVFFSYGSRGPGVVDHMGLYLGDRRMVVAPRTGTLVQVQPVDFGSPALVGLTRPALIGTVP